MSSSDLEPASQEKWLAAQISVANARLRRTHCKGCTSAEKKTGTCFKDDWENCTPKLPNKILLIQISDMINRKHP